jgi:hypothetical protein
MKPNNFFLLLILSVSFLIPQQANAFFGEEKTIYKLIPEEFLVAPEGTNYTTIHRCYSFDFDSQGNIIILDSGNYRVLKFDLNGKFLNSFGRKGKGPGEFQSPQWISSGPKDNIYIGQRNRLFEFNKNGQYLDALTLLSDYLQVPLRFSFISEKQILAKVFDTSVKGGEKPKNINEIIRKTYIAMYDLDKKTCNYISKIYKTPLGSYEVFIINPVVNKDHQIYFSTFEQKKYEIYKYSSSGTLIKTISKDYKPVKYSNAEKKELLEKRKMFGGSYKAKLMGSELPPIPEYHNSIHFLLKGTHNSLWVFTNEGKNEKLLSVDLYNENDELTKTVFFDCEYLLKTGSDRLKIYGKYAYAIILDENDEEKFVRFLLPKVIWN